MIVVNWFQFVFLREDSQVTIWNSTTRICCELISICIFTWGFTRIHNIIHCWDLLWIDFNLYFYVRIHKSIIVFKSLIAVVNWFQFVFLREDSQEARKKGYEKNSCELISICIFTWGFTSFSSVNSWASLLWIDFNLYFYVRIHKERRSFWISFSVVNWFQFVFLREDSQDRFYCRTTHDSCELISICIFTWGFTSGFWWICKRI